MAPVGDDTFGVSIATVESEAAGCGLATLGRFDEALAELDVLIAADNHVKSRYFQRAVVLAKAQRFEDALAAIQLGLDMADTGFDTWFPKCDVFALRGLIYLRGLRDARQAVADLTVALQSEPWFSNQYSEPQILQWRAEAYRKVGNSQQAAADLELARKLEIPSARAENCSKSPSLSK